MMMSPEIARFRTRNHPPLLLNSQGGLRGSPEDFLPIGAQTRGMHPLELDIKGSINLWSVGKHSLVLH